jgi:PEP-CTERM motif
MKKKWILFAAVVSLFAAQAALAGVTVLTFDPLGDQEPVLNYYAGGFGGFGTGPGPNYGVTFESNALALTSEDVGGSGNFTNEPSAPNILFFLTGTGDVMDVPSGITTGFSFFYSGNVAEGNGVVDIYSGLDGTGTLLSSFVVNTSLTPLCSSGPNYCVWEPDGVSFSGTAESVVFGGSANFIGWDDITLGSSSPGTPEPTTLLLLGSGLAGVATKLRRSRRSKKA